MTENNLIGVIGNSIGELTGDELLKDYDEIWIYRNYDKYLCLRVGYIIDLTHMTYSVIKIDGASHKERKYLVHYNVMEYLNNSTLDFRNWIIKDDITVR